MVDAKSFGRSNLLTEFFVRPVHFEKCFHVSLKGILYACTDKTSHIEMLQSVATTLMDEEIVAKMVACTSEEELYSLFQDK